MLFRSGPSNHNIYLVNFERTLSNEFVGMVWNMLSHAPHHAYEFIGKGPFKVDEIDIMVRWPEMTGQAEVAGAHDAFHIYILSYIEPPASVFKANGEFNFGFPDDYLVGPYPSKATGIEEWRTKDRGRPVLFAVQDPTNRTKMGVDRPTVICSDPNPPEIFTCSGGGMVPGSFRYSYRLYPPIVSEWPDIHVAVRKLILSMMVKEN